MRSREGIAVGQTLGADVGDGIAAVASTIESSRERFAAAATTAFVKSAAAASDARPLRSTDEIALRAARSRINVLIVGETGAGKEVLAQRIHAQSPRHDRPIVSINCAGLCESLIESELFGHERGAFTGAVQAKQGLIEAADGGTVFLDEVGELPLPVQAKLLRAIETRSVVRVGALKPRALDVRFIAATNRDLDAEVARGTFRADLLFRLDGIRLTVSPLRDRVDEIATLADNFLREIAAREGTPVPRLSPEAEQTLRAHAWPGNVRELRNVIERAAFMCDGGVVETADLMLPAASQTLAPVVALGSSPRSRIIAALESCAGNQTRAAQMLGISRRTLIARLETLDIPRPRAARRPAVLARRFSAL